ncbi:hypothetical protein DBIPINDM_002417 [Mesorhizobium sp. AR02]|uniref:hypothetical protein n=1 Tax=Mesorhizobium sp. AR02 TaxID=2865837 RepID=UPI00215ED6A7|nr:hypothetical protein [Mesorhizobium sp. AR02]UVK55853.1 hypothetical protein DBIPINDM_002417 [Mesorhizobium sp. AR02]
MEITVSNHRHPAFPQPSDEGSAIWRYMAFDKFESLVTTRTLYMCRADLLSDEFEGTTPAAELESWRIAAENAPTEEERNVILDNRVQLSDFAREFQNKYYLSCWHMACEENIAMWERYVSGPDSVVVRTRYSTLNGQLNHAVVNLAMVRYIDYDRDPLPSLNMMQLITHKRHFFADEREVRAVMWSLSAEPANGQFIKPFMLPDTRGYTPPVDVKALVEGVILHPRATPDFEKRVAELCSAHELPAPARSRIASPPTF